MPNQGLQDTTELLKLCRTALTVSSIFLTYPAGIDSHSLKMGPSGASNPIEFHSSLLIRHQYGSISLLRRPLGFKLGQLCLNKMKWMASITPLTAPFVWVKHAAHYWSVTAVCVWNATNHRGLSPGRFVLLLSAEGNWGNADKHRENQGHLLSIH